MRAAPDTLHPVQVQSENSALVHEETLSRDELRRRGEESVCSMLGGPVTLDEAFQRLASGEFEGTMVEAELRLLRRLLR
jgi:hypothetical protein